ncbi:MAG: hypothetical protein KC431_07475 [Myxococcales bacterium]|nr:hypothetical protein [Myxococcales bacterium]
MSNDGYEIGSHWEHDAVGPGEIIGVETREMMGKEMAMLRFKAEGGEEVLILSERAAEQLSPLLVLDEAGGQRLLAALDVRVPSHALDNWAERSADCRIYAARRDESNQPVHYAPEDHVALVRELAALKRERPDSYGFLEKSTAKIARDRLIQILARSLKRSQESLAAEIDERMGTVR